MNISEIIKILESNGLSTKESKTYVAMLGLDDTTPYQIAKKSGLKAPITYIVLDSLLQKGLVLKTPFKSGWKFRARKIDEYLVEKQQSTDKLSDIASLLNSYISGREESAVLVFDTIQGIDTALKYKLDETSDFVAFYGSAKNIPQELTDIFVEWYKNLNQKNIKQKIIAPEDPSLSEFRSLDKKFGNLVKEIDSKIYDSESSIEIHRDFVRIVMLTQNKCVIIEDKDLAKVLKSIFEMVWSLA